MNKGREGRPSPCFFCVVSKISHSCCVYRMQEPCPPWLSTGSDLHNPFSEGVKFIKLLPFTFGAQGKNLSHGPILRVENESSAGDIHSKTRHDCSLHFHVAEDPSAAPDFYLKGRSSCQCVAIFAMQRSWPPFYFLAKGPYSWQMEAHTEYRRPPFDSALYTWALYTLGTGHFTLYKRRVRSLRHMKSWRATRRFIWVETMVRDLVKRYALKVCTHITVSSTNDQWL